MLDWDKPVREPLVNQLQVSEIINGNALVYKLQFPLKVYSVYWIFPVTTVHHYILREIFLNSVTHHLSPQRNAYPNYWKV